MQKKFEENINHVFNPTTSVCLMNSLSGERTSFQFLRNGIADKLPSDHLYDLSHAFERGGDFAVVVELIAQVACGKGDGLVMVAGGDGTVALACDLIQQAVAQCVATAHWPHLAILPQGSGNDVARCLRIGQGFSKDKCCHWCSCSCCQVSSINEFFTHTVTGERGLLDMWEAQIDSISGASEPAVNSGSSLASRRLYWINHFSIGFDAGISERFDDFRKKHPGWCKTRFMNKVHYTWIGASKLCGNRELDKITELYIDGERVEIPEGMKNLVITNIDSYASGGVLWEDKQRRFRPKSCCDGMVEVQGCFGVLHLSLVTVGVRKARKVGQGSVIKMVVRATGVPLQFDGESIPGFSSTFYSVTLQHRKAIPTLHHRPEMCRPDLLVHPLRNSSESRTELEKDENAKGRIPEGAAL